MVKPRTLGISGGAERRPRMPLLCGPLLLLHRPHARQGQRNIKGRNTQALRVFHQRFVMLSAASLKWTTEAPRLANRSRDLLVETRITRV
jgi:hypothetical protein